MIEITVNKNDAGQRADKFILKTFKDMPKSYLYKCLRKKDIKLNKKKLDGDTFLKEGDIITLYIKDEFTLSQEKHISESSVNLKDYVIYEDENIILCDKPVGISMHGDDKGQENFVDALLSYLMAKNEFDPKKEHSFSLPFATELIKTPAELLLRQKNAEALREMNEIIKARQIDKKYLLCVDGEPDFKDEILTAYMKKDEKTKKAIISAVPKDGFKTMETKFCVIKKKDGKSLIEATLYTGRFHQIRAHIAHLGYPLSGDVKYGAKKNARFKYQALYSYKLSFNVDENNFFSYLDGKEFTVKNVWFEKYF